MHKAVVLILTLLIASCKNEKKQEIRSMNDPGIKISRLIDSIEKYGDKGAYRLLEIASLDYRAGEFLSTFMIMADKYNSPNASMKVFYHLLWMYNSEIINGSKIEIYALDSLNTFTKDMAIRYLKKADSLGNTEARQYLYEYRKKGILK